jgi:aldehyde:ferredoxin oxidoreductase
MPKGYSGKILRVDLERESVGVEEPKETLYCRCLGEEPLRYISSFA